MPESWSTLASYRLHDLLMFSADTYSRLFEIVNRHSWPAPLLGALLAWAVLATAFVHKTPERAARLALALTALAWAAVAWLYFRDGFAGIHWLGRWWMLAFLLQALAWAAWAAVSRPSFSAAGPRRALGLLLLGAAAVWPAWPLVLARPLWQAEVSGVAPDPTVLMALGLLLVLRPTRRWAAGLMLVPLGWCVFSGATLWAMAQPQAPALPLAGAAAVSALLRWRR